jgi:hypothetical protein
VFNFVLVESDSVTCVGSFGGVGPVYVWSESPVGYEGSVGGGVGFGLSGLLIGGIHVYLKNPIAAMSGFSLPLTPINMLYSVKSSNVLKPVVLFTPFLYCLPSLMVTCK